MGNRREQEERRIAEDFRRQLQERALGGRALPALAELLRWLDQNPELLEYLASRFVKENWSTKKLVREIVLSHTYRQSSIGVAETVAADADTPLHKTTLGLSE